MKVAVVGGGSTYTPELVSGIAARAGTVGVDEITLVDPNVDRLAVVGPFCQRILRAAGHPGQVRWTADLDRGLDAAGAVLFQLRVGGQEARHRDESWPLEYGCIGQETTGAGGLAKALRTVPVVLEIAARVRERAQPGAWIIDFTNPVGIVTRALLDAGHRAIGLCNVAIGFQRRVAGLLGVAPEHVVLDHVGLNHLTWERAVVVDGVDRLPELLAARGEQLAEHAGLPLTVLHTLGAVPSSYLRYYYRHDDEVARQRVTATRAQEVARLERELLTAYADPTLDHKPELLDRRGGAYYSEAAVSLLDALVNDRDAVHVVDVRNGGTFPFLPEDAVIEVPAIVGAGGAQPVAADPLDPILRGLVAAVAAYEELAVEAARGHGRQGVVAALLAHPTIGQFDLACALADRLLAENTAYLPWARSR